MGDEMVESYYCAHCGKVREEAQYYRGRCSMCMAVFWEYEAIRHRRIKDGEAAALRMFDRASARIKEMKKRANVAARQDKEKTEDEKH